MTKNFTNTLYTGDNLYILNGMNSESVDLIYLDPPFNSKRTYSAPIGSKSAGASFKDMWKWEDVNQYYLEKMFNDYPFLVKFIQAIDGIHGKAMMSYITYMTQRIVEMHRILKPTGSLYLHVDPTASHYLKIILDRIFGKDNFQNEIVWCYKRMASKQKNFNKNHDTILFYSKTNNYAFNVDDVRLPYSESSKSRAGYKKTSLGGGKPKNEICELNNKGRFPEDWWDIPFIRPNAKERTGYPTQKPLALLNRIIKASSNEGDIILDPFCGCATACVAAQQLNRKWIGIDIEKQAVNVLMDRLSDDAGLFSDFIHRTDIPHRTDIKEEKRTLSVKQRLYQKQQGICNGCTNEYLEKDFEIDHIIPRAHGGGDYYENYQLLCGQCNRIKGDRPMEYLVEKNRKRNMLLEQKLSF